MSVKSGTVSNHYINYFHGVARSQPSIHSGLLFELVPMSLNEVQPTPSQLKVCAVVRKYKELARMNSNPLPGITLIDVFIRKQTLWEMFATALDTVASEKAKRAWPDYVNSSDQRVLTVVRKVECEAAFFVPRNADSLS
jgi:hypothetical protein